MQPSSQPPSNPFAEVLATDPYPLYKNFRLSAPVAKIDAIGLWLVMRYDDVVRALRDPATFSSEVGARQMAGEDAGPPTMLFNDPPVHTRMRALVSKAFTPRVIELQRPTIEARARELVDGMLAKDGPTDIVAELAYPLPITVIAKMLGVEDGDMATFKRWSDDILDNIVPIVMTGDESGLAATNIEFDEYFRTQLERYRREPGENLLSNLVHVETDEGHLTEEELLMFCRLLLVAGNETTTGLIVNAIRAFAEFPEALDRVRAGMSLLPTAIEEALRYYAPFQGVFRRVTRDVELSGVTIPAGERCILMLASANRDETIFDRPDEFLVDRDPNRHVSFGMGIHYCLGAPLARMEADIALRTLLPRISRVATHGSVPGDLFRPGGPKSYTVQFTRA